MKHNYNWKEKREKKAFLVLEDGTIFRGFAVGAKVDSIGEVVFNTGLVGYQEIISDPSYAGQFVVMTYTEIGNYGVNTEDMESRGLFLNGFVVHSMNNDSNWRADQSLTQMFEKNNIPCIAGVDTRALTIKLRTSGALKGYLHCSDEEMTTDEGIEKAKNWEGLNGKDYASKVSCDKQYIWDEDNSKTTSWGWCDDKLTPIKYNVVAYDFGIKWNILRAMRMHGMNVTVVPAKTPVKEVLALNPDGVFFSNGPADPGAVTYAIDNAKELIGKVPIMGICLGHQILSLACGAKHYKLKFGHHGCNQPIKNLETDKVEIASHNHNFAIDADSIPNDLEVTHINLNDNTVAGIKHKTKNMFAVQYHPEAGPGPRDPYYLFEQFENMMKGI